MFYVDIMMLFLHFILNNIIFYYLSKINGTYMYVYCNDLLTWYHNAVRQHQHKQSCKKRTKTHFYIPDRCTYKLLQLKIVFMCKLIIGYILEQRLIIVTVSMLITSAWAESNTSISYVCMTLIDLAWYTYSRLLHCTIGHKSVRCHLATINNGIEIAMERRETGLKLRNDEIN